MFHEVYKYGYIYLKTSLKRGYYNTVESTSLLL